LQNKGFYDYLTLEYSVINETKNITNAYIFSEGMWMTEDIINLGIAQGDGNNSEYDPGYILMNIKRPIMEKNYALANERMKYVPKKYINNLAFKNLELLLSRFDSEEKFENTRMDYDKMFPNFKSYSLYHSLLVYYKSQNCDKYLEALMEFELIIGKEHDLRFFTKHCPKKI